MDTMTLRILEISKGTFKTLEEEEKEKEELYH